LVGNHKLDFPVLIQNDCPMPQNLYPYLLELHGILRWIVLAAALAAIVIALSGWSGRKPAHGKLRRFSLIFVTAMDTEFLLGLLLYFGLSPVTKTAFQDMAAAMKDHELRFFTVEHAGLMLMAVIFAHVGGALSRKGRTDLVKYRGAAISYLLSLSLLLAGIPWWRPLLRFD
jgi:hypothetical protein